MILLSLLKKFETDNIGTIDMDLFYEEAALNSRGEPKQGIWITSRGAPISRLNINIQAFDVYFRFKNKITASQKAFMVLDKLQEYYQLTCDLEAVPPYTTQAYKNVTIQPTTSIESVGADDQDNIILVVSGEIRYTKQS